MTIQTSILVAVIIMCLIHAYCVGRLVEFAFSMTVGALGAMIFVGMITYISYKCRK